MKIQDLGPVKGSKKSIKRVGRGLGSGRGKTSGKGHKGQKARSGGIKGPAFEGGQTVIQRRLPKRGFKNYPFKKQFVILNLKDIARLNLDVVEPDILLKKRIIKNIKNGLKILGVGELIKPITIKAHAFSSSAISKIDAIGGKYETI